MKNVIKLEHFYFPWELENAIAECGVTSPLPLGQVA